MSKIVNLRLARKQRNRSAQRAKSAENAAQHGRSAAERRRDEAEAARSKSKLDGHKRTPEAPDEA